MLPLFIAALANVTSLGVIVPLLPFQAEGVGASPATIAWLFAVYSLTQFLTAPLWGRLSDRIGRKPVIAVSFAGSALAYLWLAYADSLVMIFVIRAVAGVMNGWLATGQAYIADITTPERRARGMGMLGAAFGVGFVIGPALGGYLVGSDTPNFRLPMLLAAGGSTVALLVTLVALREPERHVEQPHDRPWRALSGSSLGLIGVLIGLLFCMFFVFSGMESTFAVWCNKALAMGPRAVGYYLSFAGIVGVFVQAWLVGRLVAVIGEARVVSLALATLAVGLAVLPLASTPPMLLPSLALLSLGFGLGNPSLLSLISREAPAAVRGGAMGLSQSSSSLGRIVGPIWAGAAFGFIGRDWPFLSGALILIPVTFVAVVLARKLNPRGGE
jgi:DHA1 family tetracycline resistance protein-like MFS transporter